MRRAVVLGLALALIVAGPAAAYYVARVPASAQVRATALPPGPTPIVQLHGRTATVTWPAALWPDGAAVAAYAISRVGSPATGACAGIVAGLGCSEARLPAGTWTYRITPRAGTAWAGAAGPASAAIVIQPPALALDRSGVGGGLPQTLGGTLTGFDANEPITWRLDDPVGGPILAGTAAADAEGTASIAVAIPAGTADGTRAIYAVGTAPGASQARADVLVDLTPPVTTDSSASLGSAWRRQATVALTPSDAGSGVAATYWTSDGTTPTASSATGTAVALAADGVYTVRYFSVDRAGNREAVRASATPIRIDRTSPAVASFDAGPAILRAGTTLTATASDPTVNGAASGVASVAYYACVGTCTPTPGAAGTTLIGASSNGPTFAVAWASPADGTYSLLAVATDGAGNTGASTVVRRSVDTTPPQITMALADATVGLAGYISGNNDFYAYANAVDAVAGTDPASVTADLRAQCGSGCAAVPLSAAGGPFTVLTSTGTATYAYRSALQRSVASATTAFSATASDLAGNVATASGTVTIDNSGKPGAPNAVTLVNGASSTGYATCATTANGYLNAATAASATVQVLTASNTPIDGVVRLTAANGAATASATAVVPLGGSQTVTFSGFDLSGLGDGTITLSAAVSSPGGKALGGSTSQTFAKLTATPSVTIAGLVYTDNLAPLADQASSTAAVGPVGGFLAFTQTAGTHVGAVFTSTALASGRLAALNLASETTSPTYAVSAVDAACNQGPVATWKPTATR